MKILIAIDFSGRSERLVEQTINLLRKGLGSVFLLHVAEPDPDFVGHAVDPPVMRNQLAQRFHEEHVRLQAMAGALRIQGFDAKALLVQGETGKTIVQQAEKLAADIIVVSASEHGALYQFLLGDTMQGVLHKAAKPVLVMPIHVEKL